MEFKQLFHLIIIPFTAFILMSIWRFWSSLEKLGLREEVCHRDQSILLADMLTVSAGITLIGTALFWTISPPLPFAQSNLLIALGFGGVALLWRRTSHAPTLAGAREEALRTAAKLQLLDAAQLAYGLRMMQEYENAKRAHRPFDPEHTGRIIEMEMGEQK